MDSEKNSESLMDKEQEVDEPQGSHMCIWNAAANVHKYCKDTQNERDVGDRTECHDISGRSRSIRHHKTAHDNSCRYKSHGDKH